MKVCGITRPEDAHLAVSLGASAVGFVLWPGSPRAVTPERVRSIVDTLPLGVLTVGVFVDEERASLERMAARAGVQAVQLHGDEPAEYCTRMRLPVIKAVRLQSDIDASSVANVPPSCMVLLDSFDAQRRGGTGRTGNWEQAREIARTRCTVLAGGLHAGNVADAIRTVAPWGIDVSSGVESSPGIKDADRMRALFDAVRSANGRSDNDGV